MFKLDPTPLPIHAARTSALRGSRTSNFASRLGIVAVLALGVSLAACADDDNSSDDAGVAGKRGSGTAGKGGSADKAAGSAGKAAGNAGKGGAAGSSSESDSGADLDASANEPGKDTQYALVSSGGTPEEPLTYFKVIDAIESQKISYSDAREFNGSADGWVYDGAVFITDAESFSMTKYQFDDGELTEDAKISFANYGLKDFGFWVNIFLSPTKAYLVNGTTEYVVWNPKTMEITGTVPMPKLTAPAGLEPFGSYTDRSTVVRDGLLYHPFYYTDDEYFKYTKTSSIAVYDVKTDKLVKVIEAPCPGLDHVTQDGAGNLYFSAWIFAPGGAANLDQPSTCVAKIAKGAAEATLAFNIKDVVEGQEGGLLRYTGNGKGILSALDISHAPAGDGDPATITYGNNWRFWAYDFATGKATLIESLDWNSGAAYSAAADGKSYMLVPIDSYASSIVYDITKPAEPQKIFEAAGWVLRLIKLPN